MKSTNCIHRSLVFTMMLTATLLCSSIAFAHTPGWAYTDDKTAIHPKAFYDINVTTPETMRNFLWVIDETYNLLIDKGVPAHRIKFAVSLRGASVTFATTDFHKTDVDGTDLGDQIRGFLTTLASKGVRIEACDISLDWMGVPAENLVSEVAVIDNAFAAAIFYQRRGFATVPITELP
jgi:intracellular sulfur oxidation DsrE/DsrF family protein